VLVIMAPTLGMREGELFGLLWDCVDLEKRAAAIVRQPTEDVAGRLTLGPLKTTKLTPSAFRPSPGTGGGRAAHRQQPHRRRAPEPIPPNLVRAASSAGPP